MLGRFAFCAEPGREALAEKHRRDVDQDPFALLRPEMQDHAERVPLGCQFALARYTYAGRMIKPGMVKGQREFAFA
jgi:hypothetical protein